MKRWEKRRYFKRLWVPIPGEQKHFGPLKFDASFSLPACLIWGYEDDSEFDADHRSIDAAMKRGLIFGRWFSVNCTDGEPGTQPISELVEVTAADFETAMKDEWRVQ